MISKHKLSVGSLLPVSDIKVTWTASKACHDPPPPLQPMTPDTPHSTLHTNLPFLLMGSLRQREAASPAALPSLPAPRAVQLLSNRSAPPRPHVRPALCLLPYYSSIALHLLVCTLVSQGTDTGLFIAESPARQRAQHIVGAQLMLVELNSVTTHAIDSIWK